MPEYLAPGVYVEETSFRSKSIEGVSTSTAGFIGPTRYGPVGGHPELIVSFADFERYYGGLENLTFGDNYLALGVRAFFEEGGSRCYVTRIFRPGANSGCASVPIVSQAQLPRTVLVARFPGIAGNIRVTFTLRTGDNVFISRNGGAIRELNRVVDNDAVYLENGDFYTVVGDGESVPWAIRDRSGVTTLVSNLNVGARVLPVTIIVNIEIPSETRDSGFEEIQTVGEYSLNSSRPNGLTRVFADDPDTRLEELTVPFAIRRQVINPNGIAPLYEDFAGNTIELLDQLIPLNGRNPADKSTTIRNSFTLDGGNDGAVPLTIDYQGSEMDANHEATGLETFEAVPDISILAAPGYTAHKRTEEESFGIHRALITHCESMRYRIAVLDTPPEYTPIQALGFRNQTSSKYGAIYYPWIYISDPRPTRPGERPKRLKLPPSGFVAGVYARNDVENAVFKSPANEVIRQAIDFEQNLKKAHQDVLNPEGVNCFRFFEGRGRLLWGARTISDDPEWKYVSLRRYFAYLERSIERGTQWAVFENNGPQLWNNVRQTVDDFLYNEWRNGGLLGEKRERAFFVRCDRSTMTQNDLDNGRLICLIGVAPVRPAEFVIFRIGQWTADRNS